MTPTQASATERTICRLDTRIPTPQGSRARPMLARPRKATHHGTNKIGVMELAAAPPCKPKMDLWGLREAEAQWSGSDAGTETNESSSEELSFNSGRSFEVINTEVAQLTLGMTAAARPVTRRKDQHTPLETDSSPPSMRSHAEHTVQERPRTRRKPFHLGWIADACCHSLWTPRHVRRVMPAAALKTFDAPTSPPAFVVRCASTVTEKQPAAAVYHTEVVYFEECSLIVQGTAY